MSNEEKKEDWSEPSLEQWIEKMLKDGYTEIVKYAVNLLPENKKEKYRELYRRVKAERETNDEAER